MTEKFWRPPVPRSLGPVPGHWNLGPLPTEGSGSQASLVQGARTGESALRATQDLALGGRGAGNVVYWGMSDDKRPRATPERYVGKFRDQEQLHNEFADLIAEGHDINSACRALGLGASTVRAALNPNNKSCVPSFLALYQEAKSEFAEKLQVEAFRRAVTGTEKKVWFNGQHVGDDTVYSDTLLAMLLKAHNPAFIDKQIVQNYSAQVDLNDMAEMSPEQREKLEDLLRSMGTEAPEGDDA